jgi:hypothetical protein
VRPRRQRAQAEAVEAACLRHQRERSFLPEPKKIGSADGWPANSWQAGGGARWERGRDGVGPVSRRLLELLRFLPRRGQETPRSKLLAAAAASCWPPQRTERSDTSWAQIQLTGAQLCAAARHWQPVTPSRTVTVTKPAPEPGDTRAISGVPRTEKSPQAGAVNLACCPGKRHIRTTSRYCSQAGSKRGLSPAVGPTEHPKGVPDIYKSRLTVSSCQIPE